MLYTICMYFWTCILYLVAAVMRVRRTVAALFGVSFQSTCPRGVSEIKYTNFESCESLLLNRYWKLRAAGRGRLWLPHTHTHTQPSQRNLHMSKYVFLSGVYLCVFVCVCLCSERYNLLNSAPHTSGKYSRVDRTMGIQDFRPHSHTSLYSRLFTVVSFFLLYLCLYFSF